MTLKRIGFLLLLSVLSAQADDSPSVDLFAGWSWYPYACGHPYPHRDWWWDGYGGPYPYVGLSRTWPYADAPWPYRYGLSPYPYDWGLGYGVRMRVYPGSPLRFPDPDDPLLSPLPGTAPVAPKDEKREKAWDADIQSFMSTLPAAAERLAATNAPAAR